MFGWRQLPSTHGKEPTETLRRRAPHPRKPFNATFGQGCASRTTMKQKKWGRPACSKEDSEFPKHQESFAKRAGNTRNTHNIKSHTNASEANLVDLAQVRAHGLSHPKLHQQVNKPSTNRKVRGPRNRGHEITSKPVSLKRASSVEENDSG